MFSHYSGHNSLILIILENVKMNSYYRKENMYVIVGFLTTEVLIVFVLDARGVL